MYLYICDTYTQLGYLFKAETSIATIKKNNKENTTKQTFSKTFPLFLTYTSFVNSTKRTMSRTQANPTASWKTSTVGVSLCEGVPAHIFQALSSTSTVHASLARTPDSHHSVGVHCGSASVRQPWL